jgi:hypothetical protein
MEVLLEKVFSTRSLQRGYEEGNRNKFSSVERKPPFREDLSPEEKEEPLLTALTRKHLVTD